MRTEIIAAGIAVVMSAGCSGQAEIKSEDPSPNRIKVEGLADSPLKKPSPEVTNPKEASFEKQFQELTAKLQEFEASVEPVPAENLAKLIELIKTEGTFSDVSGSYSHDIIRKVNGTTYIVQADFGLSPPEDISEISPAFIQIYIQRPGNDPYVIIDGNAHYNVGLPNSGQLVNGVVDVGFGYTEDALDEFRELQSAYVGDLVRLAQDVATLMIAGAQIQADYRQAVEDILGKN